MPIGGGGESPAFPQTQSSTLPFAGRAGEGVVPPAPFQSTRQAIPVTVVTHGDLTVPSGAALVTPEPESGHDHSGAECLVCNTRGNVRVLLFELLEQARIGAVPPFASVVIDARQTADVQAVIDALIPGKLPAFGLRDHTVARSFRLTVE